jgi:hypothetical protein
MEQQKERFLNLRTSPARLTVEETAWYLGFAPHEIPVLVSKGLLKPLGHPGQNTVKYFALAALQEIRLDSKWLSRATDAITERWREKNATHATGRHSNVGAVTTIV